MSTALAQSTDITRPTMTVNLPTANQRWSNAVFTARGTARDNVRVGLVSVQLNNGEWAAAATTNGWTNWTAELTLVPGTNVLRVFATDQAGNRSTTNTIRLQYVVGSKLSLAITGRGTLSPNYSNSVLELGRLYSITATAAAGYTFTNWTDGVGNLVTNNRALRFVMASNLTFRANFLDITRPTLTLAAPTANQRWSNAVFTARGTAGDNQGLAGVQYQLNGGAWTPAATTNNWTNWTAVLNLNPGTNVLRVFSTDVAGLRSVTNTVNLIYVLSAPLTLGITGRGTLSPNYSNALLEIGRLHNITATPAVGYAFTNWTDGAGNAVTNHRSLRFVMASNLTFRANFQDITRPTLALAVPTANQRWSNAVFTARGTAADNRGLAQVQYQLNGGGWNPAATTNHWTNWTAVLNLTPGTNVLRVFATDVSDNRSTTNTVNLVYVLSAPLTLGITGRGTLSPNYSNAVLELGRLNTITATPAAGYAFANWTGGGGSVVTNHRSLRFVMASNLTFTANFVDTNRPTVAITSPASGAKIANDEVVNVQGTATDNKGVTEVWCQVNGEDWFLADTSNDWTNWSTDVFLMLGTNVVRAYAVDDAGNHSVTNARSFLHVMTDIHTANAGYYTGSFSGPASGSLYAVMSADGTVFLCAVGSDGEGANGEGYLDEDNQFYGSIFSSFGEIYLEGTFTPGTRRLTGSYDDGFEMGAISLSRTTAFEFNRQPPSGIYAGTSTGRWEEERGESGTVAAMVFEDGSMVALGYSNADETDNFYLEPYFDGNGRFDPSMGKAFSSAYAPQVSGVVSDNLISGVYESMVVFGGGTFSLTRAPATGSQQANAGYYFGRWEGEDLDDGDFDEGFMDAILAADGKIYITAESDFGGAFGGNGTISAANALAATLGVSSTKQAKATGSLDPAAGTITGGFTNPQIAATFTLELYEPDFGFPRPSSAVKSGAVAAAGLRSSGIRSDRLTAPPRTRAIFGQASTIPSLVPPRFTNLEFSDGQLRVTLEGLAVGRTLILEASPDMQNWTPIFTQKADSTELRLQQTVDRSSAGQFLRAVVR